MLPTVEVGARVTFADSPPLRHAQKVVDQPRRLLQGVPGIELVEMKKPDQCCGSAGVYNIVQVQAANAILDGKIVIDAANKMGAAVANSLATFTAQTPNAKVFRAFNALGWENFENPVYNGVPADLFFSGPDGGPREQVERLISEVGLRPVYAGGPEQAGLVDGLLGLWITLAIGRNMGRNIAFKLLQRE